MLPKTDHIDAHF